MKTNTPTPPVSKSTRWTSYAMSTLPVLLLLMSGVMKIMQTAEVVKGFANWPSGSAVAIGIAELACTIIYLVPRTAVLGAILLTGYLGGATATSVQMGASFVLPVALGVLIWGGLHLRDPRLRVLIPFR